MDIYNPTQTVYYVYAYIREDFTPYYIGKGKDNRLYRKGKGEVKPPKDKSRIIVVKDDLTELQAFILERYYIRWFGRKDNNTGILLNLTNGGDGLVNPGPETRAKMSENSRNGITGMLNKKHSHETIKKMKDSAKKRGFSDEHRAKITAALTGKQKGPMSSTQRLAISNAKRGKPNGRLGTTHSEETKRNIQKGILAAGYTHSEETRRKISNTKTEKFANMTAEEKEIGRAHV